MQINKVFIFALCGQGIYGYYSTEPFLTAVKYARIRRNKMNYKDKITSMYLSRVCDHRETPYSFAFNTIVIYI